MVKIENLITPCPPYTKEYLKSLSYSQLLHLRKVHKKKERKKKSIVKVLLRIKTLSKSTIREHEEIYQKALNKLELKQTKGNRITTKKSKMKKKRDNRSRHVLGAIDSSLSIKNQSNEKLHTRKIIIEPQIVDPGVEEEIENTDSDWEWEELTNDPKIQQKFIDEIKKYQLTSEEQKLYTQNVENAYKIPISQNNIDELSKLEYVEDIRDEFNYRGMAIREEELHRHGFGTFEDFQRKEEYKGEHKYGSYHGTGVLKSEKGYILTGKWESGDFISGSFFRTQNNYQNDSQEKMNKMIGTFKGKGKAMIFFSSGSIYNGCVENQIISGCGTFFKKRDSSSGNKNQYDEIYAVTNEKGDILGEFVEKINKGTESEIYTHFNDGVKDCENSLIDHLKDLEGKNVNFL